MVASGQTERPDPRSCTHRSESSTPSFPSAVSSATRIRKLTSTSTIAAEGRKSSAADGGASGATATAAAATAVAAGEAAGTTAEEGAGTTAEEGEGKTA